MKHKIGIGIDTGGTYTDAVIYNFDEKKLIAAAKALTTRQDLSLGILEALAKLPDDELIKARLISLSTTLATNACVENRGGRAKLIFLGGDKNVINERGAKYGLPPADEIYIQECFTTFSGTIEKETDWELLRKNINGQFKDLDGAGIVEIYAMKNSGVIEKRTKEIFNECFSIPVICGHELFSDLNCLQRASSTLLNARLFPIIKEFLEAIKKSMFERKIHAQPVIVRSDGSLMSEAFACLHPVQTLLSGPAASVSGGILLAAEKDCIVVDMGGTTTDIALVKNEIPVMAEEGISIGKWKTFVRGFAVKTFGLGGDSAVHYNENQLFLEEYRLLPLCVAGAKNPQLIEKLKVLAESHIKHTHYLYEHYILGIGIRDSSRYTDYEKRFCEALEKGPLMLGEAASLMDSDIYNFRPHRLLAEGIVQISGFTPTDAMHIKNDFNAFSREASLMAARHIAFNLGVSVEELCSRIYDEVIRKLYTEISLMLLESRDRYLAKKVNHGDLYYFIQQSYKSAREGKKDELLLFNLSTQFPLLGLGAPIRVFLEETAGLLGTKAIIPEYYEVANALGAVAGKIRASCTVEIKPEYSRDGIMGYTVYGYNQKGNFRKLAEAEAFALKEAETGALSEARKRGGQGNLEIVREHRRNEGSAKDGAIFLGTTITARVLAEAALDD